jgi:hypothetical protein
MVSDLPRRQGMKAQCIGNPRRQPPTETQWAPSSVISQSTTLATSDRELVQSPVQSSCGSSSSPITACSKTTARPPASGGPLAESGEHEDSKWQLCIFFRGPRPGYIVQCNGCRAQSRPPLTCATGGSIVRAAARFQSTARHRRGPGSSPLLP